MSLQYEVNHAAGVPQTAVAGFAPRGKAWHWTAGAPGRAGAVWAVEHFIRTRYTVNASYHIPFWHDHANEITGAMEIVPLNKASHSISPASSWKLNANKDATLQEARFAEVRRILDRDNDPNADVISLSFCGMPADLDVAMTCPVFRADARELSDLVSRKVSTLLDRPHFGHGWIQPISRYEMDAPASDLIGTLYEDAMDWHDTIKYTAPVLVEYRGGTSYRLRPDLTPESKPKVLTYNSIRRVIGTVEGYDFGAGPTWDVIVSGTSGLLAVHPQDRVSTTKLVTEQSGISPASYEALKSQAAGLMDEAALSLQSMASIVRAKKP